LEELVLLQDTMEASLGSMSLDQLWERYSDFHQRIEAFASAPKLIAALRGVNVNPYAGALFGTEEQARMTIAPYTPILRAMRERDSSLAEALARNHVIGSCGDVIRRLQEVGVLPTNENRLEPESIS
jgi:DNA-binding GntR family transcriptional regulator